MSVSASPTFARSVRVRIPPSRGVAPANKAWTRSTRGCFQIAPGEAVAVNSVRFQLHRLLADSADQVPIDAVLDCVASLNSPRSFTVVEQEVDHNKPGFLDGSPRRSSTTQSGVRLL
ncbi:hypothetical protein ZWY2020_005628 [Hordeum vulgare]|nr:hypothetical protein ZWY2020_005628 [Hordeum vulgare]